MGVDTRLEEMEMEAILNFQFEEDKESILPREEIKPKIVQKGFLENIIDSQIKEN